MGLNRYMIAVTTAAVLLLMCTVTVYGAVKYKDVPETYWAYNEINDVSDRGLMVGDASGNFRPGDPIDKFETARILAKVMGYKYTNVSAEELAYYRQAYGKNRDVIAQYSAPYVKWKSAYDYEIAFLLEKEIFTVEDLSQFVVKDANGVQQYRALSKQEAAVYMVKIMGGKSEALAGSYDLALADDADIKASYKPYVYYLFSIGILNQDENGQFRPNEMVTRASLAVMLSDSLTYIDRHGDNALNPQAPAAVDATQVVSLTGSITRFFTDTDSVQITSGSVSNTYKLASDVNIFVDSFLKTRNDLKEGMAVNAVLSGGQIIEIQASSVSLGNSVIPVSNRQASTVEGTVNDIRSGDSGVAVDLSLIGPDGRPGGSKTFVLDQNCKITKDGQNISTDSIKPGDMVMADISGGICLNLTLENPSAELTGTIQEIHISASEQSIVLKTDDGIMKTLYIEPGKADIYTLRVGMRAHFNLSDWKIQAVEILN